MSKLLNKIIIHGDAWLASDFHLSENTPETSKAFIRLLEIASKKSNNLILLGDLFDAWVGDDLIENDKPYWLDDLIKSIKTASNYLHVYVLPGNRDFLLGEHFSNISGISLIMDDQTILDNNHQEILISHGDELCTDDVEYQEFRATVRSKDWKKNFLQKKLLERSAIAKKLREHSKNVNFSKSKKIMDVNESEVKKTFDNIHNPSKMIHGHTHVKGKHSYFFNNKICERWVLPDWDYDNHEAPRGGWIIVKGDIIEYCDFSSPKSERKS